MGCVQSTEFRGKAKSKKHEYKLNKIQKDDPEIKLLLLGAGESGKSTILKQIKVIYDHGFSDEQRKEFRSLVYENTIQSMMIILTAMEKLGIEYVKPESPSDLNKFFYIYQHSDVGVLPKELAVVMKRLWTDPGVQECYYRSREYHLNDSAPYYLNNLERLCFPNYVPTVNDVIRTRTKTTGVIETKFRIGDFNYNIVDVGGQRSERRKWVNCFVDVTAIIYCVSLSEYDLTLEEDEEQNRLIESLRLFQSICNNNMFVNTPIILFLNKVDIFKEKIRKSPLTVCFPEYEGPNRWEEAAQYIQLQFESVKDNPDREIYTQMTCATDTENINFVFECVQEIIISNNFKDIFA